jgi:hypothetical protein
MKTKTESGLRNVTLNVTSKTQFLQLKCVTFEPLTTIALDMNSHSTSRSLLLEFERTQLPAHSGFRVQKNDVGGSRPETLPEANQ